MMDKETRSVALATAIAAVTAAIAMSGAAATAAEANSLTGCRYETYDPEVMPRCGHEESALHLPDPPPATTVPPTVIFSIQIGEGGKNEQDRDRDHNGGGIGGNGARADRDAAGKPR
jgi:hypothetical protein